MRAMQLYIIYEHNVNIMSCATSSITNNLIFSVKYPVPKKIHVTRISSGRWQVIYESIIIIDLIHTIAGFRSKNIFKHSLALFQAFSDALKQAHLRRRQTLPCNQHLMIQDYESCSTQPNRRAEEGTWKSFEIISVG